MKTNVIKAAFLLVLVYCYTVSGSTIFPQPSATTVAVSSPLTVDVNVAGISDLYAFQFDINFNPAVLSAISVTEGSLFSGVGAAFIPGFIDNAGGSVISIADSLSGPGPGISTDGTLARILFNAIGPGQSGIDLANVILLDSGLNDIAVTSSNTRITATSVPEPATWSMVAILGFGLALLKRKSFSRCLRVILLTSLAAFSGFAQDDAKSSGITRQQADDILNELRHIRQLLERPTKPAAPALPLTGTLKLDGGFSLGSSDAPLTIVEFTDYECLFCRQFHGTTFAEIRKKYIDTGKVRFVIRDFPLSMHSSASRAAEAARCAGDQGKFWLMHDALFSDPGKLGPDDLIGYAETLRLEVAVFRSCLENGKHKADVLNDMRIASSLQIIATPSFLIGRTHDGEVDGAIVTGARPFSDFEAKLREAESVKSTSIEQH